MSHRRPAPQPVKPARPAAHKARDWRPLYLLAGVAVFAAVVWLVMQGFADQASPAKVAAGQDAPGRVGMAAPGLKLPATTGDQVGLDQFKGSKLVVYFYEGAG